MYGYKAFIKGLKAWNNFQYEIGKIYETSEPLEFCKNGFHFCMMPIDVDFHYGPGSDIEYGIVEILGDVIHDKVPYKSITNKIKVIKLIDRSEFFDNFVEGINTINYGPDTDNKNRNNIFNLKRMDNGHLVLHSNDDMPAIQYYDGTLEWYHDGESHRDNDMPAFISPIRDIYGCRKWYLHGKLHRINGPAIITYDGYEFWYKEGMMHRDGDMPAYIAYGDKKWYKNGKRHRDNGLPAIIWEHGLFEWYVDDIKVGLLDLNEDDIKDNDVYTFDGKEYYCNNRKIEY
jgi:hypothetical protein